MSGNRIFGVDPLSGRHISVSCADGAIVAVEEAPGTEDGAWLAPGLVDLQVNGYGGFDLNDGQLDPATVGKLSRLLLSRGVTRFLPTVITASPAAMISALEAIAEAVAFDATAAAMIAGIHVEGPSLSPDDGPRGAHPRKYIRPPDPGEFAAWQEAAGGLVRMVTLSPHWPDCARYVSSLAEAGVVVAIGHTDATPEQIHDAVTAGAKLSTHLGNGAAATLPRHPNVIWAQLAQDGLSASFIADGHHLLSDTLKAMIRAKGVEQSILVSDCAALGGMPPGRYEQHIGGQVDVGADGRLSVAGTPYLAGAGRTLNENVALAVSMAGISLADGIRMATSNPAALIGQGAELVAGARADIIRFHHRKGDRSLAIAEVWLAGERFEP